MAPHLILYSGRLPEVTRSNVRNQEPKTERLPFGLAYIFSALLEVVETAISGQCNIWLKTLPQVELYLVAVSQCDQCLSV